MNPIRSSLLPVWSVARSGSRLSPWSGLEAEMDRLFAAALGADGPATFPVDVYTDASATHVRAALPGCRREELRIELADGQHTLSVVPPAPTGDAQPDAAPAAPVALRTLRVPEDTADDQVGASYVDGILTVTLPRRPATPPRRIQINAA
ncbi:MAG: Hsp20/alpha crystallin family protein [Verrucomicrobiota bacterium]